MLKSDAEEDLIIWGGLYNLLARSFTPDVEELRRVMEHLPKVLKSAKIANVSHILKNLELALQEPSPTEGYVKLFEMGNAPPYETSYTCKDHPYRKTFDEADISGFYKAFGMRAKGELPDHLAAELEFMALLYLKQGYAAVSGDGVSAEICCEAREKFFAEHLSKWVDQFKAEVSKHAKKPLYPLLLELVSSVINETKKQKVSS